MEFSIKQSAPEKVRTDCIVVGISSDGTLSPAAQSIDRASAGAIKALAKDLPRKSGATRLLFKLPGVSAARVLLLGFDKEPNRRSFRDALRSAALALADTGASDACFYVADTPVGDCDAAWKARQLALAVSDATYVFERMKSKKAEPKKLSSVALGVTSRGSTAVHAKGLEEGRAIAAGMAMTRDLGNLPGNVCTPTYLADAAQKMAREWKLGIEILDRKDMERLGMGALLSVAKGSHQPPKMVIVRYNGGGKKPPVVLVGKGITFDTGGISIKPAGEMDEMKFDMCGAASVLGTVRAVAQMGLKLNVIGIVPAAENMPGGAASKPGDIVTTMSGQTVEILNTDAEGRLILCDALTYAERFKPQAVVDIATLTGACVIALGHVCSGLFSNREDLSRELVDAGNDSWDRAWPLPLWDDYQEQLRSNFADFANIGGRPAGSVTAACFLSRFTKRYDWAHLDIAGVAWRSGKDKGATGRPVPLLCAFLMKRAGTAG